MPKHVITYYMYAKLWMVPYVKWTVWYTCLKHQPNHQIMIFKANFMERFFSTIFTYVPGDGGASTSFPNASLFVTSNTSPRLYFLNRNWYASCRTRHSSSGVNCFLLIPFLAETCGDWKKNLSYFYKLESSHNTKTFDKSWRTYFVPFFSIKQGTKYVRQDLSKFLYCDLTVEHSMKAYTP